MDRILIFELNWMGDIIFSIPFIRNLKKTFPKAFIGCAVVPRYAELAKNIPYIDTVHLFPDKNDIDSMIEKISFIAAEKKGGYDTCFFLKPSRSKAFIAALGGIKERIGFDRKDAMLTRKVPVSGKPLHRVDLLLTLAEAVGIRPDDNMYEYRVTAESDKKAAELFEKFGIIPDRLVVLNPGGNWPPKRWPAENYVGLAKKLIKRFEDIEVIITGSAKDSALATRIVSGANSTRVFSLAGMTDFSTLASVFRKSALVVSADSGPLHLASAAGATVIGIFGPTSPDITGPRGRGRNIVLRSDVNCVIPCYEEACSRGHKCMDSIGIDRVFHEAERIISDT